LHAVDAEMKQQNVRDYMYRRLEDRESALERTLIPSAVGDGIGGIGGRIGIVFGVVEFTSSTTVGGRMSGKMQLIKQLR